MKEEEKNAEWKELFDGETLSGWGITGNEAGWTLEEGAIKCKAQNGGYLYTKEEYENFVLSVDFKIAEGTNSGIFVRWSDLEDPVHTGIEVQILDSYHDKVLDRHSCGALYDMVAPSENACKPPGEWSNTTIRAEGSLISVKHNGETVAQMDMDEWTEAGVNPDGTENKFNYAWSEMPREGHIGLQDHNGVIWFRSIKLKEL